MFVTVIIVLDGLIAVVATLFFEKLSGRGFPVERVALCLVSRVIERVRARSVPLYELRVDVGIL